MSAQDIETWNGPTYYRQGHPNDQICLIRDSHGGSLMTSLWCIQTF